MSNNDYLNRAQGCINALQRGNQVRAVELLERLPAGEDVGGEEAFTLLYDLVYPTDKYDPVMRATRLERAHIELDGLLGASLA